MIRLWRAMSRRRGWAARYGNRNGTATSESANLRSGIYDLEWPADYPRPAAAANCSLLAANPAAHRSRASGVAYCAAVTCGP